MNAATMTAGALVTLLVAGAAGAEPPEADHLRCKEIVADAGTRASVTPPALTQIPFDCTVRGVVRELCEPAYDVAGGIPQQSDDARPHETERVCYRLVCPAREYRVLTVADRFGTRQITLGRPRRLCVPVSPD